MNKSRNNYLNRPKSRTGNLRQSHNVDSNNLPGPGTYETSSALKFFKNRAPDYSIKGKPAITSLLFGKDP